MEPGQWLGPVDTDGEPCRFRNYYECSECGACWTDDWSCQCNDKCPECGVKDIEPCHSEDIDYERGIISGAVAEGDK